MTESTGSERDPRAQDGARDESGIPAAVALEAEAAASGPAPVATAPRGGGRRSRRAHRDWTEGSIPRNLWSLSWPQMVESLLNTSGQLFDLIWAGRLGTGSIAGLGVAQTYVQIGATGRMGFDTAMRSLVSRAVGAGNIERASHIAVQAFSVSASYSVIMAMIGVFLTEPLLRLVGVPESVVQDGADYMRIQFIGQGTMAFRMMSGAALQSSGDAITPMRSVTVARGAHVILSPGLIFGWLFLPELGLVGVAVANILAQGTGAAMNFHALFTGKSRLQPTLRGYRPDFPLIWQFIRIGAPASITSAERSFAQLLLVGFVSPFGATTLAAYALTRRIENLVMMGSRGLGQGSGIIVGQSLGAGKPERARKTVAWALGFVFAINAMTAIFLFLFPNFVLSIFSQDKELLDTAVTWLRIASLGYLFLGIGQVFQQSYNNAGDTMIPMLVTLVSIWGVQQPLAAVLPGLGLDEYGIAWAVVAAVFVRLLIYMPYYLSDRWLKVKLRI